MAIKEMVRSGGRSARIQLAVHGAVKTLQATHTDRADLTVPQIAAKAGVTPSTIYRRWGDLQGLLADVAAERLRPVGEPDDTGSTRRDVEVYMEQYLEEMSTEIGKALLRDVLTSTADACSALQCWRYTYDQLGKIAARGAKRGEAPFDLNDVVDKVVAPVVYHILFGDRAITAADVRRLVAGVASLK